ncbi:MAG: PhzF family phenazine biosynthesis protein [Cyanobacteria bacterium P01_H01_bin.121]
MMQIFQVDAFTKQLFRGNPAAVCVTDQALPETSLQSIAQEMNLSETAFLYPEGNGYRLRWFTPTVEVDLCGHATLASAHVLWTEGYLQPNQVATFQTRSGTLMATQQAPDWITLDFPTNPSQLLPSATEQLTEILGAPVLAVAQNSLGYIAELASADIVQALDPNLQQLEQLPVNGVIVTSRGQKQSEQSPSELTQYDFVSRFFAPQIGIPEDPVTGAAHCCLGPYWQQKLGQSEFFAYQASHRGGEVKVTCQGDRVLLQGQAVTVLRGELSL